VDTSEIKIMKFSHVLQHKFHYKSNILLSGACSEVTW